MRSAEGPISQDAAKCRLRFKDSASDSLLGTEDWIFDSQADFNFWCFSSKAIGTDESCLDHQLTRKPSISRMICHLLQGLEECLGECLATGKFLLCTNS